MRSLSYAGPWQMKIVETVEPTPPPGWALVDIIATGICGSDAHGYTGSTGRRVSGQVMGHETVGRLREALGEHSAGTLVTINPVIGCGECAACLSGQNQICPAIRVIGVEPDLAGSFADTLLVPEENVIALDENMPIMHGTLIEPLAVGYHAVMRGNPETSDRVIVIGGGPIGQAAALGARRAGITNVLVSEPIKARRDVLNEIGFATTSPERLLDAVESELGGPATLVIDAVGIKESVQAAVDASMPGARVVLVGMGVNEFSFEPYGFSAFERSLIGSYCYTPDHFRSTAEWVSEGHAELDLLIDRVRPFEEGQEAFKDVAEGTSGANKTLVLSSGPEAKKVEKELLR